MHVKFNGTGFMVPTQEVVVLQMGFADYIIILILLIVFVHSTCVNVYWHQIFLTKYGTWYQARWTICWYVDICIFDVFVNCIVLYVTCYIFVEIQVHSNQYSTWSIMVYYGVSFMQLHSLIYVFIFSRDSALVWKPCNHMLSFTF